MTDPCGVAAAYQQDGTGSVDFSFRRGLANGMPTVTHHSVGITRVTCARRLVGVWQTFTGVLHVDYEVQVPRNYERQNGLGVGNFISPAHPGNDGFARAFENALRSNQVLRDAGIDTTVNHVWADVPSVGYTLSDPDRETATSTTTTTSTTTSTETDRELPPQAQAGLQGAKAASAGWIILVVIAIFVILVVVAAGMFAFLRNAKPDQPVVEEPDAGERVCI